MGALEDGPLGLLADPSRSTGGSASEWGRFEPSAAGISLEWPRVVLSLPLNPDRGALSSEGWPASRGTRHAFTLRNAGGSCYLVLENGEQFEGRPRNKGGTAGGAKPPRTERSHDEGGKDQHCMGGPMECAEGG